MIKTGYLIKFTQTNIDRLHKFCIDEPSDYSDGSTTYYSVQRGEQKGPNNYTTVKSFKDWRDCEDIEELFRWGKIATPEERQVLAEEKAGKRPNPFMTMPQPGSKPYF